MLMLNNITPKVVCIAAATIAASSFVYRVVSDYLLALRMRGNLKGPTIYPLVLNTYLFWGKKTIEEVIGELFQKYGDTTYMFTPSMKNIITIDPENIQHVISGQHHFSEYTRVDPKKPDQYPLSRRILGYGIFNTDGDLWDLQRTHSNPIFKKVNIVEMSPVFLQKGKEVVEIVRKALATGPNQPVDLQNLFMKYTLDSFGAIAFGVSFDLLSSDKEFPSWFDDVQRYIVKQNINPIHRLLYRRHFYNCMDRLDQVVYDIINKKRANSLSSDSDLLSKFMSLEDANGKPFSDKWIRDIIMNFMIAGRDTTATLLTWTFYLLANHQDVMEKAIQSIEVLQGKEPTPEDIDRLDYIDWIIKESMRVRAPVPSVPRHATKDDVLPDGTIVKQGIRLRYYPYFLHRNPKYWDNPEMFIPERWKNQKEIIKHSYQYLPFHGGPSSCIGRKMAELEAKTLLILFLQNFTVTPVPHHEYKPFLGIITNCIGGCPLYVHAR